MSGLLELGKSVGLVPAFLYGGVEIAQHMGMEAEHLPAEVYMGLLAVGLLFWLVEQRVNRSNGIDL